MHELVVEGKDWTAGSLMKYSEICFYDGSVFLIKANHQHQNDGGYLILKNSNISLAYATYP